MVPVRVVEPNVLAVGQIASRHRVHSREAIAHEHGVQAADGHGTEYIALRHRRVVSLFPVIVTSAPSFAESSTRTVLFTVRRVAGHLTCRHLRDTDVLPGSKRRPRPFRSRLVAFLPPTTVPEPGVYGVENALAGSAGRIDAAAGDACLAVRTCR